MCYSSLHRVPSFYPDSSIPLSPWRAAALPWLRCYGESFPYATLSVSAKARGLGGRVGGLCAWSKEQQPLQGILLLSMWPGKRS